MEIEVAVPSPIHGTFTYKSPVPLLPGMRVFVPFGRQRLVGVTFFARTKTEKDKEIKELKSIGEVIDQSPVFSETQLKLAQWLSDYYLHPIGEVLRTMLPGGVIKAKSVVYYLTERGQSHPIQTLFGKRKKLSKAVLQKKWQQGGPNQPSLDQLVRQGVLRPEESKRLAARAIGDTEIVDATGDSQNNVEVPAHVLTSSQSDAVEAVEKAIRFVREHRKAPKPILLFGITGSGKTEVYLRAIEMINAWHEENRTEGVANVQAEPQALMLVPEISLTPQMTRVFTARFGDKVAVVHSAMPDEQRWVQLQRIRDGQARILIGPRSAVFAPFANLKLVIVDEEHDGSYKQASGLRYNGRDVAIMRAQLEGCVTLLGSATPSLESFYNGLAKKYEVVELKERASRRSLPDISCITSKPVFAHGAQIDKLRPETHSHNGYWPGEIESVPLPIDPEIVEALRENLAQKRQSIVLVNRRGYAFFLFNPETRETIRCPNCEISLTLHKRSASLHCHYCDFKEPIIQALRSRAGQRFVAIGYGSEKAEDSLATLLPGARLDRLDSDVASDRNVLSSTLEKFRQNETDLLVGTQMLAKGHDFPGVTLVAVLDVDQALNLPDFRAGERTFQLIVQAAGRAGRGTLGGRVLLQCSRENHPIIASAITQDYRSFATYELGFRQAHGYPPFTKMIAVEFNSSEPRDLVAAKDHVEQWVKGVTSSRPDIAAKVRSLGPSTPPLSQIRGRHRLQFLMTATDRTVLWPLAKALMEEFKKPRGDLRVSIDVDPQTLL